MMKKLQSVVLASVVVIAVAITVPAAAATREGGRGGARESIVKIIKRLLGVSTNSEFPVPPLPVQKP